MRIRIAENFRAVFYAPFYALQALDLTRDQGLDVEWLGPGAPGAAVEAVRRGEIDFTWGGPMRVMKDRDDHPRDSRSLLAFGEVVGRDPFFVLARKGDGRVVTSSEVLQSLVRWRLSSVSEVPTPWLCLQHDLRERGIDPQAWLDSGRVLRGLSMPDQLSALRDDRVDLVQVFEPHVTEALESGLACTVYAAHGRGPTCYTSFIGAEHTLARRGEQALALLRALLALRAWVDREGSQGLSDAVAPWFPELSASTLRSAVARYLHAQVWTLSDVVSKDGFDRLARSLFSGAFLGRPMAYEECVWQGRA